MKIDNKTLKKLYFDYLASLSPETRDDCPPPELLLKSIRGSATKRKRNRIAEHLTTCVRCSEEFKALLETIRQENEFTTKLADSVVHRNSPKQSFFRDSPNKTHRRPRVLVYALPIFLAICISAVFILQLSQDANYRRNRASPLQIIHPKEAGVDLKTLVFKWKELPDTDYYILDVFNDSLLPVWTSPKVRGTHFDAPRSLISQLEKDGTYFWMVTAFKTGGLRIESPLVEFYLNE